VTDVATLAVPGGIVGARIYHVITSPERYQDEPVAALYVWQGGLGIPGGIAGGFLVSWLMLHRRGVSKAAFADAVAPGVVIAQAIGRLGNWFNSELFGRPTTLPWGLRIARTTRRGRRRARLPPDLPVRAAVEPRRGGGPDLGDLRYRLGGGRVFALYLALYATGRIWIERLRIDDANPLLGLRLNVVVMAVVPGGRPAGLPVGVGGRPGRRRWSPTRLPTPHRRDALVPLPPDRGADVSRSGSTPATRPRRAGSHHSHRDVTGGWMRPAVFG
jgi:hypothetical protein